MTAAVGLKRLGFAAAAVTAACAAIAGGMTLFVSTDAVRDQAKAEIHAVTGLEPAFRGDARVTLFPSGSVSFGDVTLGDSAQPALRAERLTARLRFFPLLIGRVEIADVALEQPVISVVVAPDGRSNWSGLIEALGNSQKPNALQTAAFSEIRIDNGTVLLRDDSRGYTETFDRVEFSLAWPSISKSFGATGRVKWHGEALDLSVTLSDFAAALAGAKSGFKLRVGGLPFKAVFDGSISTRPTLRVEGALAADALSLRDALRWAGQKPFPGGGFERFALKAQTSVVGSTIALSGVNIELDGNSAEGVLTFSGDGRQTLQGTLAADTLDLRPYVSTLRLLTANQREWNDRRITLDGLAGLDVDLRLSAAKVVMASATLGRTAVGANLRNGHLGVTIGESQGFGGVIKGSIALANFETGVDVKSQLQFNNVDLDSCLGQLFGLRRIEGKGNFAFALEGSGESVLAVTRTLSGTASLTGQHGALAGLNVEQLMRRLERRPLSGGGEFRTGRTPYDRISALLKIVNGKVAIEDVKIEGAVVKLALAGSASIPERELDLKGTATLLASTGDGGFDLPFIVQGSWDDPIMLPDAQILIKRSGAAAPLLNAVRDQQRARDAVRSAIERLTGGVGTAIPAASTPEPEKPAE